MPNFLKKWKKYNLYLLNTEKIIKTINREGKKIKLMHSPFHLTKPAKKNLDHKLILNLLNKIMAKAL